MKAMTKQMRNNGINVPTTAATTGEFCEAAGIFGAEGLFSFIEIEGVGVDIPEGEGVIEGEKEGEGVRTDVGPIDGVSKCTVSPTGSQ